MLAQVRSTRRSTALSLLRTTGGVPNTGGDGNSGPGPIGPSAGGTNGADPTGGEAGTSGPSNGGSTAVGGASGDGGTTSVGGSTGGNGGSGEVSLDRTVQFSQTQQEIAGFGITDNWAPATTDAVADRLFSNGNLFSNGTGQLDFTMLRVGMDSDGEPYNGQGCDDINRVVASGAEYIVGTLWSPPIECKSDGTINDDRHLLESCYESWSDAIAAFADKIEANTTTVVNITGDVPENVVLVASSGPDGTVVVVAINENTPDVSVPITIAGGTAPASMALWRTSSTEDIASNPAVTLTDGTFTADLPRDDRFDVRERVAWSSALAVTVSRSI